MVSHIDADHITGLVDMFKELAETKADEQTPPYKIVSLWHNSFESLARRSPAPTESSIVASSLEGEVPRDLDPSVEAVVASVKQGNDLRGYAGKVTKINKDFDGKLIQASATGKTVVDIDDDLTFTILGPHELELNNLENSWKESKKSGSAEAESVAADYLNRTVPNLSSIVVLAEGSDENDTRRRMLLTGDAGGDLILQGLKAAGLLDANEKLHVDLLKVQHHGSNHSVTEDFFRKVTADVYVISGNGKHGIPHPKTLTWLSSARSGQPIHVYMTNRTGDLGLTENLNKFLADESESEPLHQYHFREDQAGSILVEWPRENHS